MTASIIDHRAVAAELQTARLQRREVGTLTSHFADFTTEDAYRVQQAGVAERLAAGEQVIGGKLGFTSLAMQQAMGVDSPNYGWLTDAMLITDNIVHLDELIHPKVEPEIAFTLHADLGDTTTSDDVLAATESVHACLEVVDSRYENFEFRPVDNIADNSSAGKVIMGDPAPLDGTMALDLCGVVVSVDGEPAHTAAGAAALDHPAAAVAWMARRVAASPRPLLAGDIVISGGLTPPIDLTLGMSVTVEIDRIGTTHLEVRS